MVITYKNFSKVAYPIFILDSEEWEFSDGLFFCNGKVVDDRNMSGKTLGVRRAQTTYPDLFPLKKAIIAPNGLIKQKTKTFIDSNGFPFIYEKTKFVALKYLKIDKIIQKDTASVLKIKGVSTLFTVPRPPELGYSWAGILHLHNNLPWILYEYSQTQLKNSKRKI